MYIEWDRILSYTTHNTYTDYDYYDMVGILRVKEAT